MTLAPLGHNRFRLSFIAPGDNGRCGTAAAYLARVNGRSVDLGLGSPTPGGSHVEHIVSLPGTTPALSLAARDAAGNVGVPADIGGTARSNCLSGVIGISPSAIGAVRLGATRRSVRARVGAGRARRHGALDYCVSGGGRVVVVFSRHGHAELVGVTSHVRGARSIQQGSPFSRLRHAYPSLRRVARYLYSSGGSTPILFAVRRGRVRYLAIVDRTILSSLRRNARTYDAAVIIAALSGD